MDFRPGRCGNGAGRCGNGGGVVMDVVDSLGQITRANVGLGLPVNDHGSPTEAWTHSGYILKSKLAFASMSTTAAINRHTHN